MTTSIKIIVLTFLLLAHSRSIAFSFYVDTYTQEQGLSQNSLTCSISDNKGFHWFATQDGLNRFDGYEFTTYKYSPETPSISGNWITDCLKTKNGSIWLSTTTNGLNQLNPKTGQFRIFNQFSKPAILNHSISSIASQDQNILWLTHDKGQLTRLDTDKNKTNLFSYSDSSTAFKDIVFDSDGNLLLASNNGLIKFDVKAKQFKQIKNSPKSIWKITLTPNGHLIIGSKTGLTIFNTTTQQFYPNEYFKNIWVTDILFDDKNNLWVSTYGKGLFFQNNEVSLPTKFQQFTHSNDNRNGLANDHLLSLYQDPQGLIWIGTDGYGLHRYDKRQSQFGHYKRDSNNATSLSHNFIRAILKDSNKQLWVGTRDGLNRRTDTGYTQYKVDDSNESSLTSNNIFSLYEDTKNRVWVGTYGGGLLRYHQKTDDFTAFTVQSHQLSSNRVYAITEDKNNNLWLGSNNGLTRFNPDTLEVKHFKYNSDTNSLSNNTVFAIQYDPYNDVIWVGTRDGLNKLSLHNEVFTHYKSNLNKTATLSNNMVTALYLQNANTLWVGTFGGLNKLDIETQHIQTITERQGLPNDNIFAIKKGNTDALWLSTNNGLVRYFEDNKQVQLFMPANGIQDKSFILGAAHKADDGELFFGGINGFNQFKPEQLAFSTSPPDPVITDLLINNQPTKTIKRLKNNSQDAKLMSHTDTIEFQQQDGVIGFRFSALNSIEPPSQYKYAYKLAGLDKQFLYTDHKQRQVNYSQLPSGNYQFILKVSDQYGNWSEAKTLTSITVTPPWWKSKLAYLTYLCLIIVTLWLIIASRYKATIAEQQTKKERELNTLKTQLLDNVSHELKTPLSLILAPLEALQKTYKDTDTQQKLAMIHRNSHKLLDQINQLLQLSQRPSSAVMTVSPYALNPLITELAEDFGKLFKQKKITFTYEGFTQAPIYIEIKHTHVISIISNLLSNAQKYTPTGGEVALRLSEDDHTVSLAVTDTGKGIKAEHLETIFHRFTRINNTDETGSGIGLALVKQLTEKYGGHISVHSELHKGSCFTVTLPTVHANHNQKPPTQAIVNSRNERINKILIIEDNDEMRHLLITLFEENYECISTTNGELGLSICKSNMPSLVISDVMMPVMDGYTFLKALRSDTAISHIPVLLLSAKADTQSRLKGLDLLADDYLSKPFEPQLLLGRVQGLLAIRNVLNQHLKQQLPALSQTVQLDQKMAQNKDYLFTERLKDVVKTHYQNEAFSVEEFAEAIFLSPRALQLKMKSLYNLTPSDYIRNVRLEFAQQLLQNSDLPIGIVAQQVGFNSQSYFARCFKTRYSLSPKQYREQSQIISHV